MAAEALVTAHPCLREHGSKNGWYGWKVALKFKMGNYRTRLARSGCVEVSVNAGKRSRTNPENDYPHSNIKRARRAKVNYLPNFPRGENETTLEEMRVQIIQETEKTERDQILIEKLMHTTFAANTLFKEIHSSQEAKTCLIKDKAALAAHEATDINNHTKSKSKRNPVNSVAGSYAGSVQGLLEAEIRALKSRVAAVEATRVPDGIPDSFTERLVRVEEAVMDIRECLQRLATMTAPCAVTPDVAVRALPAEREEEFFRLCQTRPDTYAASVFMALTPFEVYKCWGKNVNWSGTNGKRPLPDNLKERVHQHVSPLPEPVWGPVAKGPEPN
ncbi:hypothetical protein D5F01_LYC24472 [Larimichthys crocea]|uniref:Uncharacterized protein n=1 Tax=Larimichthys crocea TaxID=215358 RepID=A0A6G0HEU3_LARCR|nr:hypothetical protein D5F01_LYC24472 [Larimichthys crocea]